MDEELTKNKEISTIEKQKEKIPVLYLSCGIYDEKGNLHREVTLSKMTGRDRKEIASQDVMRNGGRVITTLLTNCIKTLGDLDLSNREHKTKLIREMLSADRTYLILQLRKISIGNSILLNLTCPNCNEKNEFDFNIDEIEVKPLEKEEFYREGNYERIMTIDLPEYNANAVLRYPQGYDEEIIFPLIRSNPVEAGQKMLLRCLKEFNGQTTFPSNFLDDMEVGILDALTDGFISRQPGPDIKPTIECFSCRQNIRVEVSGVDFLFSPTRRGR
ncbi:MAG: hypothetical protein AB1349_01600 [Elusimicrobiota bacterium]